MAPLPNLSFDDVRKAASYIGNADFKVVADAYLMALEAHKDQQRLSGEPYIQHPLHVALYLAKLKLDPATLAAAFLHDVAEDTPNTIGDIRWRFGRRISQLVDGVTNLDTIEVKRSFFSHLFSRENHALGSRERRIESLRKLLLASSRDVRVVLIKLADRLHNMETIGVIDEGRRKLVAQETLEIYAPLAYRLGIGTFKGQLEDLAFSVLEPQVYQSLKTRIKHETMDRTKQIERSRRVILRLLAKHGIKGEIHARIKHMYSLHKKLARYDNDLSKIYDLVAARIIVNSVEECYQVLGLIHQRWKPYDDRVKDYIASPKPNGYRSLHTTVRAVGDKPIEIQIRTSEMHNQAEYGIASHWHYSEKKGTIDYLRRKVSIVPKSELAWVAELAKWQRQAASFKDFDKLMKIDFFGDRIFVYTPKGDVVDLPIGSTAIDFAYALHSELGHHIAGAKVNGKMVRLQEELHSGDTVELLIQNRATPKTDWLSEVKTARAKTLIRRALRKTK